MKYQTFLMIGMSLTLLGSLSPALGGTLINDDFESDAIGGGLAGWDIVKSIGDSIAVTEVPSGGSRAVQIVKTSALPGNPAMSRRFNDGNSSLTVEFDYRFADRTASPTLRLFDGSTYALNLRLTSNNSKQRVGYTENSVQWEEIGPSLTANTWYHFKLELQSPNKITIEIIGGGVDEKIADLKLRKGRYTVKDLDSIGFRFGAGKFAGDFAIDNVTVNP